VSHDQGFSDNLSLSEVPEQNPFVKVLDTAIIHPT